MRPAPDQVGTLSQQLRKVFGEAGAPSWTGLERLCPPLPPAPPFTAAQLDWLAEALAPLIARLADAAVRRLLTPGGRHAG